MTPFSYPKFSTFLGVFFALFCAQMSSAQNSTPSQDTRSLATQKPPQNIPSSIPALDLLNLSNQALALPSQQTGLPDFSQLTDPSWLLNPGQLLGDGTLTFYLDNDIFGGTDENYTNGTRFSWISDDIPQEALPNMQAFLERISQPLRWSQEGTVYHSFGVSLTQLMYTPEDVSLAIPNPNERPYAGWLGLGFSVHSKTETSLDSLELAFGLTGKYSLAETSQDFIHSLKEVEKAQGWDSQIPTELTINLHYTHQQLLYSLGDYEDPFRAELIGKYGTDLGNFLTQGRVGMDLRFGYHLPPEFTYNAVSMNAYNHQLFGKARAQQGDFSLFTSLGVEGRIVGWNVSLDGSAFSDSPNVDKRPLVGEVYGSVGMRWKNWTASYRHTIRSEEYEGQGEEQSFGSLAIAVKF